MIASSRKQELMLSERRVRQRRPAVLLALALCLPALILFYASLTLLLVLSFSLYFLFFQRVKWRWPVQKRILILLFALNTLRVMLSFHVPTLLREEQYYTLHLGRELWHSELSQTRCVLAYAGPWQKIALILPETYNHAATIRTSLCCREIEGSSNPGGFDERAWLSGQGIFVKAEAGSNIVVLAERSLFYTWREALLDRLRKFWQSKLGEDNAACVMAMLLGDKYTLSKQQYFYFRSVGLAHILAVSGLHLHFLLKVLQILCLPKLRGKRTTKAVEYAVIGIFYYLSNFPAGLFRAAVMRLIHDVARQQKWRSDPLNSLGCALSISGLLNPFIILNRGVLWSYAAAASIFLFADIIAQRLCRQHPSWPKKMVDALASLVAAQTAITMLNLAQQAELNVLYLLLQLPLCFLCELIFILCFPYTLLAALLAKFTAALPVWLFGPQTLLLTLLADLCTTLSKVQLPALFFVRLDYAVLLSLIMLTVYSVVRRKRYFWSRQVSLSRLLKLAILAVLFFSLLQKSLFPPAPLIYFLDVGQGDAIVITWHGRALLLDGGTSQEAEKTLLPFMAAKGIRVFDYAILSHIDQDHSGALAELLCLNRVRNLVVAADFALPPSGEQSTSVQAKEQKFLELAQGLNIPVIRLEHGSCMILDNKEQLRLEVLEASCPGKSASASANERSLVAMLHCREHALLLTADWTARKEEIFLSQDQCEVDFLKVAHHGSADVTSTRLLKNIRAKLAVISVGQHNTYGHPAPETLRRLEGAGLNILRTDEDGAVCLAIASDKSWRCRTWKSHKSIYYRETGT